MLTNTNINLEEVRKRAAEIRGNWSTTERRRRKGLPPDIPAKLRDIILAPRAFGWASNYRT
jgi:hypothetical protein